MVFKNLLGKIIDYLKIKDDYIYLKELTGKGTFVFLYKIVGILLGYIFLLLITRTLGAEALGLYVLTTTILGIVTNIGIIGLNTALLRFVTEFFSKNRNDLIKEVYLKSFKVVIPCSILISILLFFSSSYIAEGIFNNVHLSLHFKIISFAVVPTIVLMLNLECLRAIKRIKLYAILQNLSTIFLSIILLSFLLVFIKSDSLPIITLVISHTIVAGYSIFLWFKYSNTNNTSYNDNIKLRRILRVAFPLLVSNILFLIMNWTDIILLGIYKTEKDIGIYNVALKVATLTSIPLYVVNTISAPKFAEYYSKKNMDSLKRLIKTSTKLMFWGSLPIVVACFLFPSRILKIFGAEFTIGTYSLIILAIGQFINVASGSVGYILQMTGKERVFQNILLIATVINILLNYFTIPKYGINGAAFSNTISISFWNLASMFYIRAHFKITTFFLPGVRL